MTEARRLVVSIDDQTLRVCEGGSCLREFQVSTAIKGMGCAKGSHRTPTGNFRICEKIGAGHPPGTIFRARVPVGQWSAGESPEADLVLTRILRLDGMDSNNANTLERFIYIHGTNREDLVGQPAGHGCIRLRNEEMIELFDMVAENDLLEIQPASRRRGKLLFIPFEPLLVSLDGIEEMARQSGNETHRKIVELLAALRAGGLEAGDAFVRCMESIRPDRALCVTAAASCVSAIAPGTANFIVAVKNLGWVPVLLAFSPAPLVEPVARALGIAHFESPVLDFDDDGRYSGAARGYPTTGGFQQSEVIRDWLEAFFPRCSVMMADDFSEAGNGCLVNGIIRMDLLFNSDGSAELVEILSRFDMNCRMA